LRGRNRGKRVEAVKRKVKIVDIGRNSTTHVVGMEKDGVLLAVVGTASSPTALGLAA
jgi:hypothetical protein